MSTFTDELLSMFDHFVGLAFKGLRAEHFEKVWWYVGVECFHFEKKYGEGERTVKYFR